MGIKDLNKLLKRHAKNAFFTLPITLLSGKRIAIDADGWMYTNMSTARKKVVNRSDVTVQEPNPNEIRREWFLQALNFIIRLLSENITMIFVFDGEHPPEKAETKAERRDKRIAARAKIDALYEQLNGDILSRPSNIVEELRKELRNYNYISSEDYELFKMIIKGIGIPCLQATADAEALCTSLCIEGKVAAVFSKDTDTLAGGCPLLITGFSETCTYDEYGHRVSHVDCVRLDRIHEGLALSHTMFVDLCIMCGCDFNTNMPGYAAIKSYGLIQKHESIENLPRQYNTTCLKYRRCRELFSYQNSVQLTIRRDPIESGEELIENNYGVHNQQEAESLDINKHAITTARDYLEMVGVSGQIEKIINCYQQVTPATDGHVQELNLADAPRYVPPPIRIALNIISNTPQIIPLRLNILPSTNL